MNTKPKKVQFSGFKTKTTTVRQDEAYDASKPFSPRIPVVNLIPAALVMKYDKMNLIRRTSFVLLGIIVFFAAIWGLNFALAGAQAAASSSISGEINGLQGQVAKVEPYQKYLEGIELIRSNMGKVFSKNVDMSRVMNALVSDSNANNVTLSTIKISEVTTTTEQNSCINSNPFDQVEQVGCINLSGTAKDQADVIAFFDALGKTEGLSNAFITSMGSGAGDIVFSGSISMTKEIYVSFLGYLTDKIDDLLKDGGLSQDMISKARTSGSAPVASTPKPTTTSTATPTPSSTSTASVNKVDTKFATCAEAIAAGFGPYTKGTDPEYDWYKAEDTQNTGKVCVS